MFGATAHIEQKQDNADRNQQNRTNPAYFAHARRYCVCISSRKCKSASDAEHSAQIFVARVRR